jgi:mitotic-spindle organizing protein 1
LYILEKMMDSMDALYEISLLLNTGLDRQTLSVLVSLCEAGVNPEALALVVQELRREAAKLRAAEAQRNEND